MAESILEIYLLNAFSHQVSTDRVLLFPKVSKLNTIDRSTNFS